MSTMSGDPAKQNLDNESLLSVPEQQSFDYQLECLKLEIDLASEALSRLETITQSTKNFAVVAWAASVTFLSSQPDLRKYLALTAVLPILFWLVDAWWISRNRGVHLRLKKISEFINSDRLAESFRQRKLVDFTVLDILGKQYKRTKEYESSTSFKRIIRYRELVLLYGGLAFFSLVLGILVRLI
jgi:hypothetical protein